MNDRGNDHIPAVSVKHRVILKLVDGQIWLDVEDQHLLATLATIESAIRSKEIYKVGNYIVNGAHILYVNHRELNGDATV